MIMINFNDIKFNTLYNIKIYGREFQSEIYKASDKGSVLAVRQDNAEYSFMKTDVENGNIEITEVE